MFGYLSKYDVISNINKTEALTLVLYAPRDVMMGEAANGNLLKIKRPHVLCLPVKNVGHGDFLKADLSGQIRNFFSQLTTPKPNRLENRFSYKGLKEAFMASAFFW